MKYLLLALAAFPALAQNISIGVRGGIPLTTAVHGARSGDFSLDSARPSYVIGPTFEVRLPLGLGFHVDALYRRISLAGSAPGGALDSSLTTTGKNSFGFFQFPVMAKLRLGAGPFRPFVSAGPSFSKLSGVGNIGSCLISLGIGGCGGRVLKTSGTGFAVGGGLDMKLPVIRLAPEIRYTRLGANFLDGGSVPDVASQRNQLDFLIGLTF